MWRGALVLAAVWAACTAGDELPAGELPAGADGVETAIAAPELQEPLPAGDAQPTTAGAGAAERADEPGAELAADPPPELEDGPWRPDEAAARGDLIAALAVTPEFENVLFLDEMLGFRLVPGGAESFLEDVLQSEVPVALRGGVRVADTAVQPTVTVLSPEGAELLPRRVCAPDCIFKVEATTPGTYELRVSAPADTPLDGALVRIAWTKGNFGSEAQAADFQELGLQASAISAQLVESHVEFTSLSMFTAGRLRVVEDTATRFWCLAVLQLVLIVAMQCFVAHYISGMLSSRTAPAAARPAGGGYPTSAHPRAGLRRRQIR